MKLIILLLRFFLSLRYKVHIIWEENLAHNWPVLILPNHVALVDPQILMVFLNSYLKVSPLASEKYYNRGWIKQIMDFFWTIPIWEITSWSDSEDVKKVFWKIVEWLKDNKNILLYPSGQIYRQWFENIIWKQSTYNVVNLMPKNTKVVWVKTRWLWWSMWSMAWDNWQTWFFTLLFKWIYFIFANLIFFLPRRKVNIEIVDLTKNILEKREGNLNVFNKFLEDFYNIQNNEFYEEKIKYIKHYFYFDDVKDRVEPNIISWSLKELNLASDSVDLSKIDVEIINKIFDKISSIKSIEKEKINENSKLILDLFFDSLDIAEIKSFVQSNFKKASNPPITDLKTVWDLLYMAVWQSKTEEKMKPCDWWKDIWGWLLLDKIS